MVGASKILTVSYGTFSCTLEGFEEPFSTMKAIAEYFRDLAADDRYFGAEPPTPDAQMLHQIAEREVQRRVEAKIQENGVVLRADGASAPAEALSAPEPAEEPTEAPVAETPRAEAAPEAPAPLAAEAEYEEDMGEEDLVAAPLAQADLQAPVEDEPLSAAATAPLEPDSVAAKLLRIRAAVEQARANAAPAAAAAAAPALADTGLRAPSPAAPAPVEEAEVMEEPETVEEIAEAPVAEAQIEEAQVEEAQVEEAAAEAPVEEIVEETAELAPEAPAEAEYDVEEDAQAISLANIQAALRARPVAVDTSEAPAPAEHEAAEESAEAPAEASQQEETADEAATDLSEAPGEPQPEPLARVRARVIKVRRIDPNAAPEIVPPEADAEEAHEAEAAAAVPEAEEAAPLEAPQPVEDTTAEDEIAEEKFAEDEGAFAAEAPEAVEAEAEEVLEPEEDHAPAAVAFAEDFEDEDEDAFSKLDAAAGTSLAPEAEAELQAELAAVEREVEAHRRADRGGRSILGDSADDDAMSRLMRQTETQLEGPESRRRLSTIAHLKAAVAAKEADRELGQSAEENPDEALRSYRDDLARVVRPRRPAVTEGGHVAARRPAVPADRPAPLVLVSEQRIDRPAAQQAAHAIRPRRVSNSNLAVDTRDEDEMEALAEHDSAALADSRSFAEFAERIGATSLPDLLEAAAAYSNCVEGLEHFTRPQIMRFAATVGAEAGDGDSFSREAGLRSFGALLRDGKIKKVKRGQFAISQSSRFILEARKIAR